jgi:DNA-binding transcriptional ArsR family regulator
MMAQGLDGDRERKWRVLRITKVFHRLSAATRIKIKSFLCKILERTIMELLIVSLNNIDLLQITQKAFSGLLGALTDENFVHNFGSRIERGIVTQSGLVTPRVN